MNLHDALTRNLDIIIINNFARLVSSRLGIRNTICLRLEACWLLMSLRNWYFPFSISGSNDWGGSVLRFRFPLNVSRPYPLCKNELPFTCPVGAASGLADYFPSHFRSLNNQTRANNSDFKWIWNIFSRFSFLSLEQTDFHFRISCLFSSKKRQRLCEKRARGVVGIHVNLVAFMSWLQLSSSPSTPPHPHLHPPSPPPSPNEFIK